MITTLSLELDVEPDYEERLMYQVVSDMFNVVVEFEGTEMLACGLKANVTAWVAFNIMPMELGET